MGLMKKKILSIIVIMITILLGSTNVNALEIKNEEIRVGLKEYYSNAKSIHVNNKKLKMGYMINNKFVEEHIFTSNNGFTYEPTKCYYLVSKKAYESYDEINVLINKLKKQSYKVYAGTENKGKWKIYIEVEDKNRAKIILGKVNKDKTNVFIIVNDNGYRTKMNYSGKSIIMENIQQHPQFLPINNKSDINSFDLGKRHYRGRLEFGRYNEIGISAVNIISLKFYLYSVLPSEMPSDWPLEALKAQAVTARNYAIYYTKISPKYKDKPYPICDTTKSQVYKGLLEEGDKTNKAVDETSNELIYYNNKIVPVYYFSSSGGHTENSENVWTNKLPYLKGVPDIYELDPKIEPWIKSITSNEIKKILLAHDINIGNILDVNPVKYTESKRVMNLKIKGTNGEYILQKENIKSWLGLYSRKFTVVNKAYKPRNNINVRGENLCKKNIDNIYTINSTNKTKKLKLNDQLIILSKNNIDNVPLINGEKNVFVFAGQGSGHGVGMSQSGAKGMAHEGFTYKDILKYYYRGVKIY